MSNNREDCYELPTHSVLRILRERAHALQSNTNSQTTKSNKRVRHQRINYLRCLRWCMGFLTKGTKAKKSSRRTLDRPFRGRR